MLPKTYDFKAAEARLYKFWEENGYFKPTNDPSRPVSNKKSLKLFSLVPAPKGIAGWGLICTLRARPAFTSNPKRM